MNAESTEKTNTYDNQRTRTIKSLFAIQIGEFFKNDDFLVQDLIDWMLWFFQIFPCTTR